MELVELMLLLILTCSYEQGAAEALGPPVYFALDLPEQYNRARTNPTSGNAEELQEVDQLSPSGGTRKYIFKGECTHLSDTSAAPLTLQILNADLPLVTLRSRLGRAHCDAFAGEPGQIEPDPGGGEAAPASNDRATAERGAARVWQALLGGLDFTWLIDC